jgi:co-chaperonin GroES (HSP10)
MKPAFSAHQLSKQQFQPLNDVIIVSDMEFNDRFTNSGILLMNDNGKSLGIRPRWGQIYAVGPDQTEFQIGQWVCVAHGRWTRGIDVEDESGPRTLRRIDPKDILLTSDQPVQDETWSEAVHVAAKS